MAALLHFPSLAEFVPACTPVLVDLSKPGSSCDECGAPGVLTEAVVDPSECRHYVTWCAGCLADLGAVIATA